MGQVAGNPCDLFSFSLSRSIFIFDLLMTWQFAMSYVYRRQTAMKYSQ